jgi:hypothetical protein
MGEQTEFFAISERQQVMAGLPSTEVSLSDIGATASRVFDLADECGAELEMLESIDQPPTPEVQNHLRNLTDRRGALNLLGMKLAGTPEAASQLVAAVVAYTYSQDDDTAI